MDVPPKAFKLKTSASAQSSSPNTDIPPVLVPPPHNSGAPLKLKPVFVPPQPVPPVPPQQPTIKWNSQSVPQPPQSQPAQPALKLRPPPSPQAQPAPQSATQHGSISHGKLIVHNRASIVPPVTAEAAPAPQQPAPAPQHQPILTLRPATVNKPEAAPTEISKNPAPESFVNVKPALQKTSVYDVPEQYQIPDMSEDLQKILENESENYKDQVQSFVDLCETLSKPGWQFAEIVDYIHMLVRSVNLDVLSIVLTDPAEKGKFCKVISRGYKSAPGAQIVAEWQPAVTAEATVNWNKLMDIAADKNTKLCKWISVEGLQSVGYVPLHDSSKIYGFLLVGAYENKLQSPLASSLLELCGDRIGLVLEARRSAGALPSSAVGTVRIINDELALLASYLEVLKLSAKLSPDDVVATSEKCLKTIAECKKLVDSFANELGSSPASAKNT